MAAKQWPCQYVVIRLRPDSEREEFANVGIVLYSENDDYFGYKIFAGANDRFLDFFQDLNPESYLAAMEKTKDRLAEIKGKADGKAGIDIKSAFDRASSIKTSKIMCSEVKESSTSSPSAKLLALFDQYVT